MTDNVDDRSVIKASGAHERDLDGQLRRVPVQEPNPALAQVQQPCDELRDARPGTHHAGPGGLRAVGGALASPAAYRREALNGGGTAGGSGGCGGGRVGLADRGRETKD